MLLPLIEIPIETRGTLVYRDCCLSHHSAIQSTINFQKCYDYGCTYAFSSYKWLRDLMVRCCTTFLLLIQFITLFQCQQKPSMQGCRFHRKWYTIKILYNSVKIIPCMPCELEMRRWLQEITARTCRRSVLNKKTLGSLNTLIAKHHTLKSLLLICW